MLNVMMKRAVASTIAIEERVSMRVSFFSGVLAIWFCEESLIRTRPMDTLIADLLQYSRITRAEITSSRVNVQEAINQALDHFDKDARSKIVVNVEPKLAAVAHQPTLVQAVSNLVSNA